MAGRPANQGVYFLTIDVIPYAKACQAALIEAGWRKAISYKSDFGR